MSLFTLPSINITVLQGTVIRIMPLEYLEDGTPQLPVTLATEEWYYEGNERKTRSQYHRVAIRGKSAERVQEFLVKQQGLQVKGKLTHRTNDVPGGPRYVTEVVVEHNDYQLGPKPPVPGREPPARQAPAQRRRTDRSR
jgi:single-stranded DNA-binding protein